MAESPNSPELETQVAGSLIELALMSPGTHEPLSEKPTDRMRAKAQRLFVAMFMFEASLGLLALVIGYWLESPAWRNWDWSARAWGYGVVGTIPPLLLLALVMYADWDPLARFRTLLEKRVAPIFAALRWWQLLLLAAAAGWGEELLFRGLLQPLFCQWLGVLGGVGVLAVIFGLAHALSRLYFVLTVMMSLYLSWLLESTSNLAVPVAVHALYDGVALLIVHKEDE